MKIILEFYHEKDLNDCQFLLNQEINSGWSYPFDQEMTADEFKAYFLAGDTFVIRSYGNSKLSNKILATFYIKPNFPGHCSHICNGGFLVAPEYRGKGLGIFMGRVFPYLARDLGYKASLFNLVFDVNQPSTSLWRKLGYQEIGRIPRAYIDSAGKCSDANQFYLNFDTLPPHDSFSCYQNPPSQNQE